VVPTTAFLGPHHLRRLNSISRPDLSHSESDSATVEDIKVKVQKKALSEAKRQRDALRFNTDSITNVGEVKVEHEDLMTADYKHRPGLDMKFTVYGDPAPLSRHMLARGRMYNPSSNLQKEFLKACQIHMPTLPPEGAMEAYMVFYFRRPKNHYYTGKNSHKLKSDSPSRHHIRRDLDNLVKFVLDALNGIAYKDDGQVASIKTHKFFTNLEPRTEITIREIPPI
jgi:Holliday junction resolvase RusA-like endonuclease